MRAAQHDRRGLPGNQTGPRDQGVGRLPLQRRLPEQGKGSIDNKGTIKYGGHTNSKLYNYSNKNRNHPIKGAYAREVDSWNNNTSPIKALVNSGIGYALTPVA